MFKTTRLLLFEGGGEGWEGGRPLNYNAFNSAIEHQGCSNDFRYDQAVVVVVFPQNPTR